MAPKCRILTTRTFTRVFYSPLVSILVTTHLEKVNIFQIFVEQFCILFWEESFFFMYLDFTQAICPSLLYSYVSSLFILKINILSYKEFLHILACSISFAFIVLVILFDEQKLFKCINVICQFLFLFPLLWCLIQNKK